MAPPHIEVADIYLQATTHLSTPKGWEAETYIRRLVTVYPHKWSLISCRSSVGQGKFNGQRPTFYHCATPPTKYDMVCCRHTIAPISHTRPSPRSRSYYSFSVPLRVGGWVGQWIEQTTVAVIVRRCRSISSSSSGVGIISTFRSRPSWTSASLCTVRSRTPTGCNGTELWTHVCRDVKSSTVQHRCNPGPAGKTTSTFADLLLLSPRHKSGSFTQYIQLYSPSHGSKEDNIN